MPKITSDEIVWLPTDRNIFSEVSPGITTSAYASLFQNTLTNGDTTQLFKFWEEIYEKDSDIIHAIDTRSSMITSKDWFIEGPNQSIADELEAELRQINGVPEEGLLTVDQLISALLGPSYLIGISVNEIVTDSEKILGFNPVPHHFLTFQDSVSYPKLYTQEVPTGVPFNKEKMIVHYLSPGSDPVRGWLGHAVGWQYVFKANAMEQRFRWQGRYGKGFLLVNMPGDKDSYEEAWNAAENLVDNLYDVDGAVFPADVTAEMVDTQGLEGDYFFKSDEDFKRNIVKIILGQTSTSDSQDSNRSTATVHQDVLENRIIEDMELIQDTLTKQLVKKVQQMKGMSTSEDYQFKFEVSDLEEEVQEQEAENEETSTETR